MVPVLDTVTGFGYAANGPRCHQNARWGPRKHRPLAASRGARAEGRALGRTNRDQSGPMGIGGLWPWLQGCVDSVVRLCQWVLSCGCGVGGCNVDGHVASKNLDRDVDRQRGRRGGGR
jgi:hypothetical protein